MTEIPKLSAHYDSEELCSALSDYGCCVVEGAVSEEVMDAVANEMAPFVEDTPRGTSDFAGAGTRRTGLVIGYQLAGPALGHWRNAEDPFIAIGEYRAVNR